MGATSLHSIENTVLFQTVFPLALTIFFSITFNLHFTYKESEAQQISGASSSTYSQKVLELRVRQYVFIHDRVLLLDALM